MPSRVAWIRAAAVLVVVVAADQLTKRLIVDSIRLGETRSVLPGLQFVHTRNRGVAFGFLSRHQGVVIAIIAVALLAMLAYFARRPGRPLVWLPTGLLLGGAISNIFDRLRDGSVTDFIKLPLGWPPFNLADMAITFGVLSLLYVAEGPRRPAPEQRGNGAAGTGDHASSPDRVGRVE